MKKKKSKYITLIDHTYVTKNKLEAEIWNLLRKNDRTFFETDNVDLVNQFLINQIEDLNRKYPRCKPIKAEFWSHDDGNTFHLHLGTGICNFKVIRAIN